MENKHIKSYSLCGIVCKSLVLSFLGVKLSRCHNLYLREFTNNLDYRSKSDRLEVENEVHSLKKQSSKKIFLPQRSAEY